VIRPLLAPLLLPIAGCPPMPPQARAQALAVSAGPRASAHVVDTGRADGTVGQAGAAARVQAWQSPVRRDLGTGDFGIGF